MALSWIGSDMAELLSAGVGVKDGAALCSDIEDSTAGEVADDVLGTCGSDVGEVSVADSDAG